MRKFALVHVAVLVQRMFGIREQGCWFPKNMTSSLCFVSSIWPSSACSRSTLSVRNRVDLASMGRGQEVQFRSAFKETAVHKQEQPLNHKTVAYLRVPAPRQGGFGG